MLQISRNFRNLCVRSKNLMSGMRVLLSVSTIILLISFMYLKGVNKKYNAVRCSQLNRFALQTLQKESGQAHMCFWEFFLFFLRTTFSQRVRCTLCHFNNTAAPKMHKILKPIELPAWFFIFKFAWRIKMRFPQMCGGIFSFKSDCVALLMILRGLCSHSVCIVWIWCVLCTHIKLTVLPPWEKTVKNANRE